MRKKSEQFRKNLLMRSSRCLICSQNPTCTSQSGTKSKSKKRRATFCRHLRSANSSLTGANDSSPEQRYASPSKKSWRRDFHRLTRLTCTSRNVTPCTSTSMNRISEKVEAFTQAQIKGNRELHYSCPSSSNTVQIALQLASTDR